MPCSKSRKAEQALIENSDEDDAETNNEIIATLSKSEEETDDKKSDVVDIEATTNDGELA